MTSKQKEGGVNQDEDNYDEDLENDFYEENESDEGPFTAEE